MLPDDFRAARLPSVGSHLDTAACGRASRAVLDAVAPVIDAGRTAIATLLGFDSGDDVVHCDVTDEELESLADALAGQRVGAAL